METTNADTAKKKTKKIVLYSLGTLVLGTLAFFGIKHFTKPKNNNDDTSDQTNTEMDTEETIHKPHANKPNPGLPANHGSDAFPLSIGSKGSKVKLLQESLIRSYGSTLLPKYGADGSFGRELANALKIKGYEVPLQEADYTKITAEKKEEAPKTAKPLLAFDPAAVAKGIYYAITAKDYRSSITLLKSITNTTNYTLVSENLKSYRINGVRQTLVNAMLTAFKEKTQKQNIQSVFLKMGLKFDGKVWKF